MRKVTERAVQAFLSHRAATVDNTHTDGQALYLFGNKIAEHSPQGIRVTLAGWNTPTTRERLNGLPGVRVHTKAGQAYLNGKPWNGQWTAVDV